MRRLTIFGLALGALLVVGLVLYATIALAHSNTISTAALLAAQSHNPALWALDIAALYGLLLTGSYYGQHVRARSAGDETLNLRDSHRAQLEAMLANAKKFEEVNADQADEISEQQEQIKALQQQITDHLARIAEQQEQITAQRNQIDAHASDMAAMSAQVVTLQVETYTQADQITRQAQQLSAQTDQNNELLARTTAQSDQNNELLARIALQENQIAEMADRTNAQSDQIAEQTARIAEQEESIRLLSVHNTSLQAELESRQEAFTVEERRLTEKAFRAMAEQVDFNTRQIETVNRMLQYHQAELQQLRHERLALQPASEQAQIPSAAQNRMAALAPGEPDADGADGQQTAPAPSGWQRKL